MMKITKKRRRPRRLNSGFAEGLLQLWITDELLSEINRNKDPNVRAAHRIHASRFPRVKYDPAVAQSCATALKSVLPCASRSQVSDINQIAKTAASEVRIFVTRDQGLLKHASTIEWEVGIRVLSPAELLIRVRELGDGSQGYQLRLAGSKVLWKQLTSGELRTFPFQRFVLAGEAQGKLRQRIEHLIASSSNSCQLLWWDKLPIAFRVLSDSETSVMRVELARTATGSAGSEFRRFLLPDLVHEMVRRRCSLLEFSSDAIPLKDMSRVAELGLVRNDSAWLRFSFRQPLDSKRALEEVESLRPGASKEYRNEPDLSIERMCSPASITALQNHFVVPIRPEFALNLFDTARSAADLFGGTPEVLFQWSNVYFRTPTYHHMLAAPGRILWYVSKSPKAIVAVSHLDAVDIGAARDLMRKYSKIGTLTWRQLFDVCGDVSSAPMMALSFSHTFSFDSPISLGAMRTAYPDFDMKINLQSPQRIPIGLFDKFLEAGFGL